MMSDEKLEQPRPRRERYLKWRRRLARLTLVLLAAVIVFRVVLAILLPVALNKAAGFYGMDCEYDRLKLSLLGGSAAVWDLRLSPKGGGEPIASVAHAGGDISVWDLLRAKLSIWRLEADGIDVYLERKADGSVPLLARLAQTSQKSQQVREARQSELDFTSPLSVEAISLARLRLHLKDERVRPSFDRSIELSLSVDNLGAGDRPAQFALAMHSGDEAAAMIDELRVAGTLRGEGRRLSARAQIRGWGLRAASAAGYLEAMGLRPVADSLELDGEMNLITQPVDVAPDAVQAHLQLTDLRLRVDHESSLALRNLTMDAPFVSPRRLDLGHIEVSGAEANVSRTKAGLIRVAGFELTPIVAATQPTGATAAAATRPAPATLPTLPPLMKASIDELLVKGITARFHDELAGTQVELRLDELRGTNWATYPRQAERPAELRVAFGLPGIASRATLALALDPFAGSKTGNVQFEMTGMKLDAAAPYLAAAGLASEFSAGTLRAEIEGSFQQLANGWLKGDLRLKGLSLRDREELFSWDNAAVRGLAVDPRTFEVNVDAIELVGPRLRAQRDAAGAIHLLGLRTGVPVPAAHVVAAPATAPTTSQAVLPIPRLHIGTFSWTGIGAQLADSAVSPATTLELSDAGIVVENISLERDVMSLPGEPAKLRAWICAPGIVERLQIAGTVAASPQQAKLQLSLDGKSLRLARLAPYLAPLGMRPVLQDASLRAALTADAQTSGAGMKGSISVSNVALVDNQAELAGLGELTAALEVGPGELHLGEVKVVSPRVQVRREPSGDLSLLGLQLMQSTPRPRAVANAATAEAATRPAPAATVASPFVVMLDHLRVENADARWNDVSVLPPADWRARTQLDLQGFCIGTDAPPARLHVATAMPGVVEQSSVDGTLRTGLQAQAVDLAIAVSGIRGSAFDSYLPPSLRGNFKSGDSSVRLLAEHRMVPGADEVSVELRDFSLRDGATRLAAFASAGAKGVRISQDLQIGSLFMKGGALRLERTAAGEIAVVGLRTESKAMAPLAETAQAAATRAASPHADADVLAMVTAARKAAPLVQVDHLDVAVDELRFSDASRPAARDLVVRSLLLSNGDKPLRVLGQDPFTQPSCDLRLTFSVEDLVQRAEIAISALPFAATPSLKTSLDVTGIHGEKLAEFVPEMKGLVDGAPLQGASAHADLRLSAKIERRGAAQFDFRRDFSLYATLRDLRLQMPGEPTLLGVEAITFPEIQVRPGSSEVIIPSLDISRPIAHVYREKDGVHVAGLRIAVPSTATSSPAAAPMSAAKAQAPAPASTPAAQPAGAGAEILVKKLTISGIDVSYEDRAVEPRVVVPLTGLEFEAADISSKAATAAVKPMRFSGLVYAGKVSLPQPKGPPTTRPVFTQITTSGQMSLYPQPQGWVKTSLSGFELVAIAPLAKPYGVDISGGVNDVDADVRIRNRTDADVNARVLVNDLALSEKDNGPIFRALHLPAPTSAIIGLMEDVDGSITLRLSVPVRQSTVSVGSIVSSAMAATTRVIATAVASAPMKLVSGLTGGGGKKVAKETRLELRFAPGDGETRASDRDALLQALEKYRFDRQAEITISHQLGKDDVPLATGRVNPGEEDTHAVITQLRANRDRLLERRREAEARARTELATYSALTSQRAVTEVQAISRELSQTEDALDRVLELLRPGAKRQADRRTRAAAIELGERRLAAVESVLATAQSGVFASRITKVPARFAVPEGDTPGEVVVTIVSRNR